jgi:hypothetical protein
MTSILSFSLLQDGHHHTAALALQILPKRDSAPLTTTVDLPERERFRGGMRSKLGPVSMGRTGSTICPQIDHHDGEPAKCEDLCLL